MLISLTAANADSNISTMSTVEDLNSVLTATNYLDIIFHSDFSYNEMSFPKIP